MKKTLITTALLATAGATTMVVAPAHADVERRGSCGGASYALDVDRERGGFEVDADVEDARPGSAWRLTIRHDGTRVASRVLRADREGELDLDTFRRDTAGADTFRLTVTPTGGPSCSTRLTVR
jgi:hypothetical protein